MSSLTQIGRSALDALGKKLEVTANNIANADTPGFKRSRAILEEANPAGVVVSIQKVDSPGVPVPATDPSAAEQESSNVSLEEEIIDLLTTKRAFEANTKPLKAEDEMVGSLLDSLGWGTLPMEMEKKLQESSATFILIFLGLVVLFFFLKMS